MIETTQINGRVKYELQRMPGNKFGGVAWLLHVTCTPEPWKSVINLFHLGTLLLRNIGVTISSNPSCDS